MEPGELHGRVVDAFNAADVDALVDLYEPDACFVGDAGATAHGTEAIRAQWEAGLAFGGTMTMKTLSAYESGDIALLSNEWTVTIGGTAVATGVTSEVARRQADGSWRYVIDNPNMVAVTT